MSRWSNGEYRSPHGGDNVFGASQPSLWDSRPMKSPFPSRSGSIYDWRSGDDDRRNPPPGGSKVPRKPKSPVGSGGASRAMV